MKRAHQIGLTLIEISFVLAAICFLATMLLIGRKLTINTKVNRLDHDLNSIQTAIYNSQEKSSLVYRDDQKPSSQFQEATIDSNSRNEIVNGTWQSSSGETFDLWQNVRPTGFAQNRTEVYSNKYIPIKSAGIIIDTSQTTVAPIAELKGHYIICTDNIAGEIVKQLDLVMDDGNTASGSMMASNAIGGQGIATDSIVDNSNYMVCMGV